MVFAPKRKDNELVYKPCSIYICNIYIYTYKLYYMRTHIYTHTVYDNIYIHPPVYKGSRTSTNLGRSNRLSHVCTKMMYGKYGVVNA